MLLLFIVVNNALGAGTEIYVQQSSSGYLTLLRLRVVNAWIIKTERNWVFAHSLTIPRKLHDVPLELLESTSPPPCLTSISCAGLILSCQNCLPALLDCLLPMSDVQGLDLRFVSVDHATFNCLIEDIHAC